MRWTSMVVAAVAALSLGAAEFDLGNFIRSRYRAGEREIVLPDGEVRCRGMVELGREFRDLTIRGGRDTKLVCTNLSDLFFLNGCSNVTMRDFAVDYDPLPFTQGTVTAIDRGGPLPAARRLSPAGETLSGAASATVRPQKPHDEV